MRRKAVASPQHGRGWLLLIQLQHPRAVVERRRQQMWAALHERRNGDPEVDLKRDLPEHAPRRRIERTDGGRMPDHQLPGATCLDDDRLLVAWLPLGPQR